MHLIFNDRNVSIVAYNARLCSKFIALGDGVNVIFYSVLLTKKKGSLSILNGQYFVISRDISILFCNHAPMTYFTTSQSTSDVSKTERSGASFYSDLDHMIWVHSCLVAQSFLKKMLCDYYLCFVDSNKQQINWENSKSIGKLQILLKLMLN